jgi:RNA-directed DNA polymerase
LPRSTDEHGKPTDPDRVTPGQAKAVKPLGLDQRAEQSAARNEEMSSAEGELWARVWERENLNAALKRVEQNGGAPGIDGMTVRELRPYLKAHWVEHRAQLDAGT